MGEAEKRGVHMCDCSRAELEREVFLKVCVERRGGGKSARECILPSVPVAVRLNESQEKGKGLLLLLSS